MNDPLGLDPLGLDDPLGLEKKAHIPRWPGDDGSLDITTKQDNSVESRTVRGLKGWGETALSLGTSIPATFLGGVAGLTAGINPLSKEKNPLKVFEKVSEDLTYSPRTEEGQRNVQTIGSALQFLPPVGGYLPHLSPRAPKPIGEPLREVPKPIEKPAAPKTTVDSLPPEVREQQAFFNRQQDPLGLDTELRAWEQPEPNRGDLSRQEGLPFTDSVEAVREAQVRRSPQPDMFVQENQLQRSFDPYQENLRKQADAERMDLERVAEESRKQQEMDAMLAKRQQDLFAEKEVEAQTRRDYELNSKLDAIEQTMLSQKRPSIYRRNQLGAIDLKAVQDAINKFRSGETGGRAVIESFRGAFTDNEYAKLYSALNDPKGKDTVVLLSPQQFHSLAAGRRPHEIAEWGPKLYPEIKEGLKGEGLWDMPHLLVDKKGQVLAHEGRHRMDVFKEMNVGMVPVRFRAKDFNWGEHRPEKLYTEDVKNAVDLSPEVRRAYAHPMPEILSRKEGEPKYTLSTNRPLTNASQRGVIDLNSISEGIAKLARLGKDAPEIVKATGDMETDVKKEVLYNNIPGLDAFRPIWTPEKVIAAATQPENFRDLTSVEKQLAKTVKPGIRTVRVSSNNPLINLMGETYSKMFSAAEEMARTYITNNDGIGPVWQKLSNDEKMQIHKLLKQGDNEQRRFTTAELDEAGYTKDQQLFMAKFYDMDAAELDLWNEKRLSIGMDPVKERPGHFRSVFKGDYWALAMENDDKGVPRVVGFVGNNTKWGFEKVKEQLQKENPSITFTEMKRRGLGGSYRRTDLAQGMADIMDFMAKNDPRIAEIRDAIKQVTDQHADGWLGAAEHALQKKGIWGNEGNKPWEMDMYKAADEAMKAYFTSWEEAVLSHHHLEANATFTALDKNEAVRAAWPNALDYVNKYSKAMTGNYTSTLGVGLNNLLDWGVQTLSFNQLGPTITREGVNQFTKRMGQLTQGFLNPAYTAMQLIQPLSTAAPEMMRVGGMADASKSSLKGIEAGFKYVRKALDPDFVVDADTAAMFAYAEDRGLLTFSEFDDVSKVTQGKVSRAVDQAIDFNRVAGEISTRPTVFFTFVDMLKDMGLPKEEIFDTAYNLTQYSMTDYSPAERALMYRDLGVVGQLAGSLSQFKHSYVNQVSQWVGDSFKNPKTALVGITMMATLAGYRGLPGYDDLDAIVKYLTNKYGDKQMSINDIIASNAPEWFNAETPWAFDQDSTTYGDYLGFGGLSGATGVNLSSRLGSAQLLPESPAEAVSPYMGKAVQIGKAASELGTNPRAPTNLAINAAPSSIRGPLENKMATSESGMLLNKEGQNEYQRSDFDRKARNFGLTSLEESKNRDGVYQATAKRLADEKRRSDISHEVNMKFNQIGPQYLKSPGFEKLKDEYIRRKGDPETLINNAIKYKQESQKTGKQRAEGEASGFSGAQRYKYYNP